MTHFLRCFPFFFAEPPTEKMLRATLLAAAACALGVRSASVSANNNFDYFMLVLQWPITQCEDTFNCQASQNFFTLHGLWPERNDGSYPSTCTSDKFNPNSVQSILSDLQTYWPSLNGPDDTFWAHEYEKHGTCAASVLPTQLTFFNTTLALRARYDIVAALAKAGIAPSNSQGFSINTYLNAIATAYGASGVVDCDSKGNIAGHTLCIGKNLKIQTCPSNQKNTCSANTLYLPATQTMSAPAAVATNLRGNSAQ